MGSLLNVDYNDELTRLRVHEIVKYFQRLGVPIKLSKISNDIIADSFYVHYRTPILKDGPDKQEESLWHVFIKTYTSSDVYHEISKISRYNYQVSKSASVKLLRAYNSLLSRIERGAVEGFEDQKQDFRDLSENQQLRNEISNLLRFYMGNVNPRRLAAPGPNPAGPNPAGNRGISRRRWTGHPAWRCRRNRRRRLGGGRA